MFKPLNYGVDVNLKTVGELAEELYVSPKHLSEVLKKETGRTAIEHIHDRIFELLNPVDQFLFVFGCFHKVGV